MSYATSNKYSPEQLELASSKVDELTYNRIARLGIENFTPFQQQKVKAATLAQAEYYDQYGTDAALMSGFSLLDTSISFGNSTIPAGVSPTAIMHLKQTGLMSRVVSR